MKNISHQEDNIIDELDLIEKGLDKYLDIVEKKLPRDYDDNNYLYQTTLELEKETKLIQNEINSVQKALLNEQYEKNNSQDLNMEKLDKISSIPYDNIGVNESYDFDVNLIK